MMAITAFETQCLLVAVLLLPQSHLELHLLLVHAGQHVGMEPGHLLWSAAIIVY